MSLIDRYIEEMQHDTSIDEFTMKDVQMKLPAIKHKWTGRLIRLKIQIAELSRKKKSIIVKGTDQLMSESPVKLTAATVKQQVEKADVIVDINKELQDLYITQEFLEKAEKILNSMTFDIKNLTDIIKLETQ